MAKGGISRAVKRLLRPFHRHHKTDDSSAKRGSVASNSSSSTCSTSSSSSRNSSGFRNIAGTRVFPLKSDGEGVPHTVMMPPVLFRQMRALSEQSLALVTGEQQRASTRGGRETVSGSSRSSRWRGDLSTKYVDRLATLLTEDDTDGFAGTLGRRSAKPVPLETAAKALLQIWKCCMQILDVLADNAAPEPTTRHTVAHSRDVAFVATTEKRRLLEIFEQLTGQQVLGSTEWKIIPGADVLMNAVLAIAKKQFQTELEQREPKWQDEAEEQVQNNKEPQLFRESFTLIDGGLDETNTASAFYTVQLMNMMHENVGFVHNYMMVILESTNYMIPHHVVLCLKYMEKLVVEYPAFFVNELAPQDPVSSATATLSHNEQPSPRTFADVETMRYIFTCLLSSEHFEILKTTELFLLKHFTRFSVTVQLQITQLFAKHVKRLFLHWNRDVRYLYYHILLYLTYPGNRLVLSAKSDEALMGSEASQLFEIPGLVRAGGGASWDVFDIPLQQIVGRYTQVTKKRRQRGKQAPSWVDAVPWTILQRSVTEYKTHVKTYFAYARQLSLHQRVPTPIFSVKSEDSASSPSSTTDSPRVATAELRELRGNGLKFPLHVQDSQEAAEPKADVKSSGRRRDVLTTGFVFFHEKSQQPRAFINRCPHALLELDLDDSDFFCEGYIHCKAHAAFFDPETGICLQGPISSRKALRGLDELRVEIDGADVVLLSIQGKEKFSSMPTCDSQEPEAYKREKQKELAEALSKRSNEVEDIQQQLHKKTMARLRRFQQMDKEAARKWKQ
ncbi:hypothetical protein PHYBOEH_000770 [Phytophthora boehmeriae]|uniref:Rieske domain-containing protein n=1 Tax=Phytophthora boehmeriae TaxID=109152 RepID=A0A8T1WVD6_9STRA|nr:hypothetical protein PHYBOEH_000770 [Phytophthora boehmeriae]